MRLIACLLLLSAPALAQERRVELHFTPTARAQIAIWIESADGTRFATVGLTESVAVRGIGNRPGALQMNSGYRWPYGRREGVLPVWAHRRVSAGGAMFPRVIFDGRYSEGDASNARSRSEPENTLDPHYCLRFAEELSRRDELDATTCATPFFSNKGRYLTGDDVRAGYAEPWQDLDGRGRMRALPLGSLYPARRDSEIAIYDADVRAIFPEIDAVTMATFAGDLAQRIVFDVPRDWPDGAYDVYLEIHVEGDYGPAHHPTIYPTPTEPSDRWDGWAIDFGYPYRGQPSIVFRVPIALTPSGGEFGASDPIGYGALHGDDGELRAIDGAIVRDVAGSGIDRLRSSDGDRLRAVVPRWNVCDQPDPPAMCGVSCTGDECGAELICGPEATCVGRCDVFMAPDPMDGLTATAFPDESDSHRFARVAFRVPASRRSVMRYELRVGTEPIVDEASFARALPAVRASTERVELTVPVGARTGELVEVDIGGLSPETTYYVAVRAIDECNSPGAFDVAEVTTTAIHFTTVSPCFIATAAYGSPLEPRIAVLRRFRDRHLRTNAIGRALVAAYEAIGPHAADAIREDETARAIVRSVFLDPIVSILE